MDTQTYASCFQTADFGVRMLRAAPKAPFDAFFCNQTHKKTAAYARKGGTPEHIADGGGVCASRAERPRA